jgi:hypothetical protein
MSFGDWLTGKEPSKAAYRVVLQWGPNLVRHVTRLSEHRSLATAVDDMDQRTSALMKAGAQPWALTFMVLDAEGIRVDRERGVA